MNDASFFDGFIKSATMGFAYLLGIGLPFLAVYIVKDFVINVVSCFLIKGKSSFQLHNNFEFRGRKNCKITETTLTQVHIFDVDTRQILRIYNKDFVKVNFWENPFEENVKKEDS